MNKDLWKLILTVPGTVLVYVPLLLLLLEFGVHIESTRWIMPYLFSVVLFWGGLVGLVMSFNSLVNMGKGTPAPWKPTTQLVTTGIYRYVRNPMLLSVWSILLAETLYFGSWYLAVWTVLVVAASAYYTVKIEEVKLANKFGQSYITYKLEVGRWLPKKIRIPGN